jgi:hypothetical protein
LNAAPFAQNESVDSSQVAFLEGTWVARFPSGGTRAFVFHVTGPDSFSGSAGGEIKFTNGKFDKGYFSFSSNEAFYTGFVAADHLDILEELHFSGYKAVRKPNSQTGPNPLDGDWSFVPPRIDLQLKVNGSKLEGNFIDTELEEARAKHAAGIEKYADVPTKKPFLEGSVRGNEAWLKYMNRGNESAQMVVKLLGDHLEITTDVRRPLVALKRVSATPSAAPAGANPVVRPTLTLANGKMAKYESFAADAMEAVSRNDLDRATSLCQQLEEAWDSSEAGQQSRSPEIWQQIDRAMDGFIHPITRSAGQPPDAKTLDVAYKTFVSKLKLAN